LHTLSLHDALPIPSGNRLSKRDGATSVLEYKNDGYLPDALVNYLVRLGWAHGDQELFTREELITYFTLDAVGKKGAIFDREKLNWVNSVYLKQYDTRALLSYIQQELDPDFVQKLEPWTLEDIVQALQLYKERVATVKALMVELIDLHDGPKTYNSSDMQQWTSPQTKEHLDRVLRALEAIADFTSDGCAAAIKQSAQQLGIKLVNIAQPIRIALLGKSAGPGIFELLQIVGKKESIERIRKLQTHL
jgi:glutamyl-tRNA synthetase